MDAKRVGLGVAAGAGAVLFAGAGVLLLLVEPGRLGPVGGVLIACAPFCFARVRRAADRLSTARNLAALHVAFATVPLVRLALWNAASPTFEVISGWNHAWADAYGARFGNADDGPWPGLVAYVVVAAVPSAVALLFVGLLALAVGYGIAAGASALVRRRPAALVSLAVAGGVVLGLLWPLACDFSASGLPAGWWYDDTRTCTCLGVEFADYPPGVSDAGLTYVCVGLEVPH